MRPLSTTHIHTPPAHARLARLATRSIVETQTALAWLVAQGWQPTEVELAAKTALDLAASAPSVMALRCPACVAYGWVHLPPCPIGGYNGALAAVFASPVLARHPAQVLAMGIAPEDGLYLVRLPALPQKYVPRPETSMLVARERLQDVPRDALVWWMPREVSALFDPALVPGPWRGRGFAPLPWPEGSTR